jgi:hypothetical protein
VPRMKLSALSDGDLRGRGVRELAILEGSYRDVLRRVDPTRDHPSDDAMLCLQGLWICRRIRPDIPLMDRQQLLDDHRWIRGMQTRLEYSRRLQEHGRRPRGRRPGRTPEGG